MAKIKNIEQKLHKYCFFSKFGKFLKSPNFLKLSLHIIKIKNFAKQIKKNFLVSSLTSARKSIYVDGCHFHTLEINRADLDDSGSYVACAKNPHGSVSCSCMLVVDKGIRAYVAPEFTYCLDVAYAVKVGGELKLVAQVEAYPSVGVVW